MESGPLLRQCWAAVAAAAAFVTEHRLWDIRLLLVARGLSCSAACGLDLTPPGPGMERVSCVGSWILIPCAVRRAPSLVNLEEGAGSRLVLSQGLRGCSVSTLGCRKPSPLCTSCHPRGPLCMGLQAVGSSPGRVGAVGRLRIFAAVVLVQPRLISRTQSCVRERALL